jgi:hypothetical protein
VAGVAGVPVGAAAVALNVTATGAEGDGWAAVFPCGTPTPTASNLNVGRGQTVANLVVAKVGGDGTVCVLTSVATHLVVDLGGWLSSSATYGPLNPARLLDSRPGAPTIDGAASGAGLRPAGSVTELVVTGRGGVPSDAAAVALNVTVTEAQADGYVTVFPCEAALPGASNLNFRRGQTVPNLVIAKVGTGGRVCLFTSAATQILADVNGAFRPASLWSDLAMGASGARVVAVQQALTRTGVATAADGSFGSRTQAAVSTFQAARGLPTSGVADVATAVALGLM